MECNIQNGKCTHCGGTAGGKCSVEPAPRKKRLGDRTEQLLASIGITEEYYTEVKQRFGLPPNCACQSRKRYLNQVSDWFSKHADPAQKK